jgi:hypothetical protein
MGSSNAERDVGAGALGIRLRGPETRPIVAPSRSSPAERASARRASSMRRSASSSAGCASRAERRLSSVTVCAVAAVAPPRNARLKRISSCGISPRRRDDDLDAGPSRTPPARNTKVGTKRGVVRARWLARAPPQCWSEVLLDSGAGRTAAPRAPLARPRGRTADTGRSRRRRSQGSRHRRPDPWRRCRAATPGGGERRERADGDAALLETSRSIALHQAALPPNATPAGRTPS